LEGPLSTQESTRRFSASLLVLIAFIAGCTALSDLDATADVGIERTTHILDEGIAGLQNNSADWQKVLRETEGKLVSETQSTIRNEVSDLLYRGIAATSAEVRCDTDFVVNRVRLGLLRIRAELLKEPVPPLEPQLCSVIPLAVDRTLVAQGRLNRLELYGYDLDAGELQVLLQDGDALTDVSDMVNRPTHYHMTLTLGGRTGVPITSSSQRLIIKSSGHELSTISVIQPETPLCKTQVVTHQPAAIHFIPPKADGAVNGANEHQQSGLIGDILPGTSKGSDADFKGHGPDVNARVRLINDGTSVSAELFMSATETRADWTRAEGSRTDQIYVPDTGWRVKEILVPTSGGNTCPTLSTCFTYTDTTPNPDIFSAGSGPVQRFEFTGDTSGSEAGTRTGMLVTFNPLRFELTEVGNCVAPSTVSQLRSLDLIAPETLEQLAPERR
jgi:hypothetical protein